MTSSSSCASILASVALLVAGCGSGDGERADRSLPTAPERIGIFLTDLRFGRELPIDVTCAGVEEHPGLTIGRLPAGTRSLAIVMEDADADRYVHWTAWDLPPSRRRFAIGDDIPVEEGEATGGDTGYEAACPPEGGPAHTYRFAVYALRTDELDLDEGAKPSEVYDAIEPEALARGEVAMSYFRTEDKPFG